MVRSFKEQTKIAWKESDYKKSLSDSEKAIFKSLSRNQKDTVIAQYIKDEPISLLDNNSIHLINKIIDRDLNTETIKNSDEHGKERIQKKENKIELQKQKAEQENRENLTKFFDKQGIPNPTNTTLDAFSRQRIDANVDKVLNSLGMFTTNREKQAQYNYYVTQQKQNFIQIAQNDKLIKQNDEIIDLLKTIANK
ncbi:hypothetical protein [Staphylococcus equorum]|uniref:hypothetical protein n=1 Tax=Staphylococcus equorum TaxID=246432 RepID=UPI000A49D008|nr:hypothetical protein [Staphylococcus equorum]